ncbi:surfeit locus protein 6-domain-containing protein [Jimgerdemannia flammicorona]|uniref:Surfeit locus protein 6-domain-containing protein n=1 Tax=Jimgerdemannia flammicorona TaxID=994334 RepID=A0A433QYN9_9FUNG|nr:surfeit locus protein 6-domain-containing protein [Jimgerdemannia flammicorona]
MTPPAAPTNLATKPMESANITDLHLRLQHRIAELRAKRHASSGDAASKAPSRDAILEMRLKHKEKRKQMKEKRKQKEKHARVQSEEIVKGAAGAAQQHKANGVTGPSPASIKEDGEVRFSKVEMGEAVQKKKGPTDAKGQLKKAEAKMEKMEKLKAENKEKAETLAEKETWKKALAMASGEKVRDDVKLLKKTVKREEKIKKRSEKAWTERKDTVQKQQAHKQKKRQDNIQARIEQKKDKGGKGKKVCSLFVFGIGG